MKIANIILDVERLLSLNSETRRGYPLSLLFNIVLKKKTRNKWCIGWKGKNKKYLYLQMT